MVNIDDVYQQVLVIANKEQRGYITPQEFNLFANLAQREIFEQYFYDYNYLEIRESNKTLNKQTTDLVRTKRDIFLRTMGPNVVNTFNVVGNAVVLPDFIYRISRLEAGGGVKAEYTTNNEFKDIINGGPLVRPSSKTPIWSIHNGRIRVHDGANVVEGIGLHYYEVPVDPRWGYFIVGDKALYEPNPAKTTHFELHESEQPELIWKVLKFAGISMKRDDVLSAGQAMENLEKQQEKI